MFLLCLATLSVPSEDSAYDAARRCTPKAARPGIAAPTRWLGANTRGVSWGSYRCEKWGRHSASLHAENRAVDWHLEDGKRGKLKKHVDPTVGHRNHVHIGMTKAGAAARTSFWRGRR